MKPKTIIVPLVAIALIAGLSWYLVRPQQEAYGSGSPAGADQAVVKIGDLSVDQVGQTVAIEGTIKQECPHSGCWAVIEDGSGQIRIDTQKGGFALPLHQEGSHVRVVGELEKIEGDALQISAQSAEL